MDRIRDALIRAEALLSQADKTTLFLLIAEISRVQVLALAAMGLAAVDEPEVLVSAVEAATMLGIGLSTLYRTADRYPFTVRNGATIRFSRRGIQQWIATRMGATHGIRRGRDLPKRNQVVDSLPGPGRRKTGADKGAGRKNRNRGRRAGLSGSARGRG